MMSYRLVPCVGLVIGLLVASAQAQVYQWRDADGKVHFSDKKPKAEGAKDISHTVDKTNVDESTAERSKLERLFKQETPEEKAFSQQQAQVKQRESERQQAACEGARNNLKVLRGPVYFTNDDGSTYDVSQEEHKRRVATLEAEIRKYCP